MLSNSWPLCNCDKCKCGPRLCNYEKDKEALSRIRAENGPTFFPYPGRHPYFVTGSMVTENEIKAYDAGSAEVERLKYV